VTTRETEQTILDAAREILAADGVGGLTVEGVAERAGVAKTTIYRRYRSKQELALAVLLEMVHEITAVADMADTRAELVAFLGNAVRILGTTLMGPVMKGLTSSLATDPKLVEPFRQGVVATRIRELGRVLERGVERGDVRPGVDHALVHDLLFGPVYYRLLLSGGAMDDDLAARVVDAILPGLAVGPAAVA
jgi:AcrR family transcriptional regulator